MALLINFVRIKVSSFLTNNHYFIIFLLSILGAFIVTAVNQYLSKSAKEKKEPTLDTEDSTVYQSPIIADTLSAPAVEGAFDGILEAALEEAPVVSENLSLEVDKSTISKRTPIDVYSFEKVPATTITNTVSTEKTEVLFEEPTEPKLIDEISSRFERELSTRQEYSYYTPSEISITELDNITPEDLTVSKKKVSTLPVNDIEEPVSLAAEAPDISQKPDVANTVDEDITSTFTSLDEFLNYADEQKKCGAYKNAAYVYEQAIINFPDSSYLPFIVIDIANIHKTNGLYLKAIAVYQTALSSLPAIRDNEDLCKEFDKTLTYLEAVEYILSQHNIPNHPFAQIPADYLAEIEQEFLRRQQNLVS